MRFSSKRVLRSAVLLAAVSLCLLEAVNQQSYARTPVTSFGISGSKFTINGSAKFLLGVSYFDGRYWRATDLDTLAQKRYNLIRIWLDWSPHSFFDSNGYLDYQYELLDLVRACATRGIVVDVTILDTELDWNTNQTVSNAAVQQVVTALAAEPNVFLDVVNEHNISGDTFTHAQVETLINTAHTADNTAITTVSSGGKHIVNDLTLQTGNIDAELSAGVQFLTPHLTRTSDWYGKTDQRVKLIKDYLAKKGRNIPVYLQEEARRGHSGLNPTKAQFVQAAKEAKAAGAAGWIFHTDAGFDLAAGSFFSQLDSVETDTVNALPTAIFGFGAP